MFGQTVQTQIILVEQSDQGLHCLLFHLSPFDKIGYSLAKFSGIRKFRSITVFLYLLSRDSFCVRCIVVILVEPAHEAVHRVTTLGEGI